MTLQCRFGGLPDALTGTRWKHVSPWTQMYEWPAPMNLGICRRKTYCAVAPMLERSPVMLE